MANRQKYPAIQLRGNNYEVAESREPGERVRKIGIISIDRSVFHHSRKEKDLLKIAKLQCKIDELRK